MKIKKYGRVIVVLIFLVVWSGTALAATAHPPIRLAYKEGTTSNVIVVHTAASVLEHKLGYGKVKFIALTDALQWMGVANDNLDVMMIAWLPVTQAAYWKRFKNDVDDLGVIFHGKIGWVVPDYIPKDKLDSITDLKNPEVRQKLGGIIQGIEPSSGLMGRSKKALKKYGLDKYDLRPSSTPAMMAQLSRQYGKHRWIVVTGWEPLAIFAKYKLRFLKDPNGVFGAQENIHALARLGFRKDMPRAATFIAHYKIPMDILEKALLMFKQTDGDIHAVVHKLIKSNPDLVNSWVAAAQKKPRYSD